MAALVGGTTGAAKKYLLALLAFAGLRPGSVGPTAVAMDSRTWSLQATTPQERAGLLLQNPTVDVALLETSAGELLREGFGTDRCNVALILGGAQRAELEEIGVEAGDWVSALRHALAPDGIVVLPVEGEAAGLEPALSPGRVFLVAAQNHLPGVQNHLAAGGRALVIQGDAVVLAQGAEVVVLGKCPGSVTGREVPGFLAALAAGLVLGEDAGTLQSYLHSLP
jgi:cyanophycin synthetase